MKVLQTTDSIFLLETESFTAVKFVQSVRIDNKIVKLKSKEKVTKILFPFLSANLKKSAINELLLGCLSVGICR